MIMFRLLWTTVRKSFHQLGEAKRTKFTEIPVFISLPDHMEIILDI